MRRYHYKSWLAWFVVVGTTFLPSVLLFECLVDRRNVGTLGYVLRAAFVLGGGIAFWVRIPRIVRRYRFEHFEVDEKGLFYTDEWSHPAIYLPRAAWRAFKRGTSPGDGATQYWLISDQARIRIWSDVRGFAKLKDEISRQIALNESQSNTRPVAERSPRQDRIRSL